MNGVAPLVQGRRFGLHTPPPVLYAVAAAISGAAVGLGVGYGGRVLSLSPTARNVIAIVGLSVLAAREMGWIEFPVPQLKLRVPRSLVSGSAWMAALIWGGVLGFGFLTFIKFTVFWGMQLVVFTMGSPRVGVLTGALYGVSRALPTLLLWMRPALRAKWLVPGSPSIYSRATLVARIGAAAMMVSIALLASAMLRDV